MKIYRLIIFSFVKYLHFLLYVTASSENLYTIDSARIMGGIPINISKAKFVVSIRLYGVYKCVGSLVTPRHVVTAAHCVAGKLPSSITVTGGTTLLSESGVHRNVRRISIPRNYNRPSLNMDLAILELSSNMTGDNISTIALCAGNFTINSELEVYGWGRTRYVYRSNRLRMVAVPLISRSRCERIFKRLVRLTPSMFCAGDLSYRDACFGDSGGPAVHNNQLCGVVSWGPECASKTYPGVYTNINVVRSFIEQTVNVSLY